MLLKLLVILNFANTDMVGHTGSLEAAIKAVETVDECVGKVVEIIEEKKGNFEKTFIDETLLETIDFIFLIPMGLCIMVDWLLR